MAERRAAVSCVLTSRGGCTSTRHSTATMTMAAEERIEMMPNKTMVAYSEPTATTAGYA